MNSEPVTRQVYSLPEVFFNDGHWYVLTSQSRGGTNAEPEKLIEALQSPDPDPIAGLLRQGVLLPLCFDGDCALDSAKLVVGELTPREEEEWLGRIQSRLEIPCGAFIVIGGGGFEEDWEPVIDCDASAESTQNVARFEVPPGAYLVELYAFVRSMTFNVSWDGHGYNRTGKETAKSLAEWWQNTRPGEPYPDWLTSELAGTYKTASDLGLQEYVIRLRPWREEDKVLPVPQQIPGEHWCGVFEYRRNIPCPRGLRIEEVLEGGKTPMR